MNFNWIYPGVLNRNVYTEENRIIWWTYYQAAIQDIVLYVKITPLLDQTSASLLCGPTDMKKLLETQYYRESHLTGASWAEAPPGMREKMNSLCSTLYTFKWKFTGWWFTRTEE